MSFTCTTCRVAFQDTELHRQHYKSDWHRYNLKRKVADLPSVTAEEFQKRVLAERNKSDLPYESLYCKICRKPFNAKKQYDNHLISKRHKENSIRHAASESGEASQDVEGGDNVSSGLGNSVSTNDRDNTQPGKNTSTINEVEINSDVESVDSDEWIEDTENPAESNNCLFCNHHSRSLSRNLMHMTVAHSFFVPDLEYCVDVKGLLVYLGEKIFVGYMCIWCNTSGKRFQSADAARAHMLDKGHCKMLHEGEALAEYIEFYNYSASYPEAGASDNPDAEVELPTELDDSDYQLVLPSGNVIGHRSLMKYYKQNLNPNRVAAVSKSNKLRNVLLQYRALGWTGVQKEAIARKARDIKYMQKVQAKYSIKLQVKANKLQHHFRRQVMF